MIVDRRLQRLQHPQVQIARFRHASTVRLKQLQDFRYQKLKAGKLFGHQAAALINAAKAFLSSSKSLPLGLFSFTGLGFTCAMKQQPTYTVPKVSLTGNKSDHLGL
jgi:hypothetical protein